MAENPILQDGFGFQGAFCEIELVSEKACFMLEYFAPAFRLSIHLVKALIADIRNLPSAESLTSSINKLEGGYDWNSPSYFIVLESLEYRAWL
jgi:hypothetical protein